MDATFWDVPETEEGLQHVLSGLAECRATGDQVQLEHGLLKLSYLVKWVRSDTDAPPFARGHELALQAVQAFRQTDSQLGLVKALVAASALADPESREAMLSEAEGLAEALGDANSIGSVLAARARAMALVNRVDAAALHRRALEIFRRTDNKLGMSQCLFALAICDGEPAEKETLALEAAEINRELKDFAQASRCMCIALMNAEEIRPLRELEELAQQMLKDAHTAGNRTLEKGAYDALARIAIANNNVEEANQYIRWAKMLEEADGRTPRERWEDDVAFTKMMIATAKQEGSKDAIKMFEDELKRLKRSKPRK